MVEKIIKNFLNISIQGCEPFFTNFVSWQIEIHVDSN
jgi:hypothetical protein